MSLSDTKKPAHRRYYARMAIAMAIYLASLLAADWLIRDEGITGPLAAILATIPGLCTAAIFWILARLVVEERDEYLRMLLVRQLMIATGIALSAAAIWGYLEMFELAGHIDAYWWPAIWCFGTGIGGIYNKITMGTAGNL